MAGRSPKIGERAYARSPIFKNSFDFREVLIVNNRTETEKGESMRLTLFAYADTLSCRLFSKAFASPQPERTQAEEHYNEVNQPAEETQWH